jgi:putative iron-dependent peroxidase
VVAQVGIFALGTVEHGYLEFDLRPGSSPADVVAAAAGVAGPATTTGGVNLVVALRPEVWAGAGGALPAGVRGFDTDLVGVDGYRMPATQHDVWIWVAGGSRSAVFDNTLHVLAAMTPVAAVAAEVTGWLYHHDRDLTGFIDGTENPTAFEASTAALVAEGPGAGGSVVLVQQWRHDADRWLALPDEDQERVMGRTKADSVELADDVKPVSSHVARTAIEDDAGEELEIYRRNTAYGTGSDHGTMFVAFSTDQHRLNRMLRRMAGTEDGVRDELTRFTEPLTGGYYWAPPADDLALFLPARSVD